MSRWLAPLGALLLAAAVATGAFGAHALRQQVESGNLTARDLDIFQTGVFYHFVHGLGLLFVGWKARDGSTRRREGGVSKALTASGVCFLVGIVVFSGSLYTLVLTGERKWGAVTPLGGLAFIVGWLLVTWSLIRTDSHSNQEGL